MVKLATKATTPAWPADKVSRRKVETLIPYARNARLHSEDQVAQIAASIREWGWTVPVLLDEHGGIIAGHGRVLAARKLAIETVPCMVARGWSDAQKAAYVIADNKIALNAGWDEVTLKAEIEALQAMDFDIPTIGFSSSEIDDLFKQIEAPDDFPGYGEDINTEHKCPKCGYVWSGNPA